MDNANAVVLLQLASTAFSGLACVLASWVLRRMDNIERVLREHEGEIAALRARRA